MWITIYQFEEKYQTQERISEHFHSTGRFHRSNKMISVLICVDIVTGGSAKGARTAFNPLLSATICIKVHPLHMIPAFSFVFHFFTFTFYFHYITSYFFSFTILLLLFFTSVARPWDVK